MVFSLLQQFQQWQTLLASKPLLVSEPAVPKRAAVDLEQLGGVFGPTAPKAKEPPRKTTLPLTLLGSFVSAQVEHSAAVIQVAGKAPKRVVVGREVTQGVHLEAVSADHVVLTRGGVPEHLFFPRAMAVLGSLGERRTAYPAFGAAQLRKLPALPPDRVVQRKLQGLLQERGSERGDAH
nr:type II secretion system protein N [Pseudomonas benzenivorans]